MHHYRFVRLTDSHLGVDDLIPMSDKATATLSGTVEKIVVSQLPNVPDKAQINVAGGEPLYREIRIVNSLTDKDGKYVRLEEGQRVDVTVEVDTKNTTSQQ